MKFLVDAQLPCRFAQWLAQHGHDALHTLDLPGGNRTPDRRPACRIACAGQRARSDICAGKAETSWLTGSGASGCEQ
ncbi:MAG: hypothetical protein FJ164_05755 [Gammaproteobacteria bacterium]|nr:hypothetical protein [Gammaproteobacteria bacterium]